MYPLLLLMAAIAIATQDLPQLLLPTASPITTESDPYQCATEYLPEYFETSQPPQPTGALSSALLSWGHHLNSEEPCTFTGTKRLICPFPAPSRWCAFTTAAPTNMLPAWSSYGSSASSWWDEHSSSAVSLAQLCPSGWYNAMWRTPGGRTELNRTLIMSQCYEEALTTASTITPTEPATTSVPERTRNSPAVTITSGPSTIPGTVLDINGSGRNGPALLLLGLLTAITLLKQMTGGPC
ncbi:hypothetical protein M409DRAFT_58466 [Zasmidium cellare ATCC 36951]|uniref:DUF7735 domain-containing protein n=1 Tax=Zasmidium cellare ATCC 36951 TaxID=1080233 RepID=A0A6A6C8Z2_ZASCE|nr:uncharacterized protein M409DRAFT_58466 [Zasmidium cellare ATCC 36951]KAF2162372.1 hypothetical protein M409DRAFT_58466 [Zasmidium cellare ATCC 36951]